jgi:glucose/arabinose dehydrogenase
MTKKMIAVLLFLAMSAAGCRASSGSLQTDLEKIQLPPGFSIHIYSDRVPGARSMTLGAKGTLFVGTRREGKVYALVDSNHDGRADRVYVIASGLFMPNGVAFRNGSLYVAEVNRVIRFDHIESRLTDPPKPVVVNDHFPDKTWHGWKFIRFGPDGELYVPVGAPCNVCLVHDPFGTIMRMKPDGSNLQVYARGVRNSVGFDWNPATKVLWFTDNGRDNLGDNVPPDELNRAPAPGMNFGFPYCHGGDIPDPKYGKGHPCKDFTPPAMKLGPHVASLGMRFYTGRMFPREYDGCIFIAEHGSWNRTVPIGYRVAAVFLEGTKAVRKEIFAGGWLQHGQSWGRPVDVQQLPDGSLLVSDDKGGAIYRITYRAPKTKSGGTSG